ncbi:rhombosortase [Teredinibacter franksiae]|uniref:rhombosortase n=1 Tax=Teredinibacter franksiae TaxID=2761453 RepID=UPI001627484E|nr:rhombosortase [Teredinibacter franksiae]
MSYPPPHTINPIIAFQCIALALFISVLALLGDWLNPYLLYQREAVFAGQWWRLLTGHLVHLGVLHGLLNIAGLLMLVAGFPGLLRPVTWWIVGLLLAVGISIGFVLIKPELSFYAGLSGVLHGLFTLLLIVALAQKPFQANRLLWVVLGLLLAKLGYEQLPDYSAGYIEQAMAAPVIVDAHLFGAVLGAIFAFAILFIRFFKQPRSLS